MKKFFSTLIVLAVISSAMIAETKSVLSINASLPVDGVSTKVSLMGLSDSVKVNYTSFGFGIGGLTMFNNLVGIYSSVDIAFQLNAKLEDETYTRDQLYGSNGKQYSFNIMFGPVFKIIDKNNMLFTAAPAVHMYTNYTKTGSVSKSGTMIGLGGNAGFSYFFNDLFGITAGVDLAYDFVGLGSYKKQTESSGYGDITYTYSNFQFTPKFGVSFKF